VQNFFIYLDIIGPLLPLPFFLLKKRRTREDNIILVFLAVQLLLNLVAKYLLFFIDANNIIVYQLNAILSFVVAALYFLHIFSSIFSAPNYRYLKAWCIVSLVVLLLIARFEDVSFFNSLSYSFTAFSICLLCVLFYLNKLGNVSEENIVRTGKFWIVSGFFIYYGGSFFIFLTYRVFTRYSKDNFTVLWSIHNFIFFIFCCLTLIAVKWEKSNTLN